MGGGFLDGWNFQEGGEYGSVDVAGVALVLEFVGQVFVLFEEVYEGWIAVDTQVGVVQGNIDFVDNAGVEGRRGFRGSSLVGSFASFVHM